MTDFPDLNQGAIAPVSDEVDIAAPDVTGTIPDELSGTLVRNGPNPFSGRFTGTGVLSWWPEAAMLHGVTFRDGHATHYRNRWVRTQNWAKHHSEDTRSLVDTNPNINIISHAGVNLALAEGGPPLTINPGLETLGPSERHSGLTDGITGHPKVDPVTGELIAFRAHWSEPYLQYAVFDSSGAQQVTTEIDVPAPSMMHDFAITQSHSIFLDLNVAYDLSMMSQGYRLPLRWHDERSSRLGILSRTGGPVRWLPIEPCFIQHVVNAYDADDSTIVLDAVRYPWYLRVAPGTQGFQPNPPGTLWRYIIDLQTNAVTEHQADDLAIELPRINDTHTGQKHRFLFAVEQPTAAEMRGIIRYDRQTGSTQRHAIPTGDQNSEPVFVPRPNALSEDDGWLVFCIYRHATDTSDVIILDARDISGGPLAAVHLPRRIPAGFHGAWLPHQ